LAGGCASERNTQPIERAEALVDESIGHDRTPKYLEDILGGAVVQSQYESSVLGRQPTCVSNTEDVSSGIVRGKGSIGGRKGVVVGSQIKDTPVRNSDDWGGIKIGIGDLNGEDLLARLKIFEESIHPIVYGRVGGASHRSSEKLVAVKNLNFTHGCWVHRVGEKGHPGLGKTVFSIPNLMANFGSG
jgi:hypothetical protein